MSGYRKQLLAIAGAALALLVTAPTATAVTRYAHPMGGTAGNCTNPDPMAMMNPACSLDHVIDGGVAVDNDEVIVLPGDHDLGAGNVLIANQDINVHGAAGQPMPRVISSSAAFGFGSVDPQAIVSRLRIDYSGTGAALGLDAIQTAEQLVVHSTGGMNVAACDLETDAMLRDSVCFNSAANGIGLEASLVAGTGTVNLRNVTSVATGAGSEGIRVRAVNAGAVQNLVGKNVIADGVAADVRAQASNATSAATATMTTSNYDTELESPGSGMASVTNPGPPDNQSTPALFSDAGLGLFHQAFGSPTINAGETGADLLGMFDVDGEPRVQNGTIDIGADEGNPLPPTVTPPPTTSTPTPLTQATPRKKCKKGRKLKKGRCVKKKRKKKP